MLASRAAARTAALAVLWFGLASAQCGPGGTMPYPPMSTACPDGPPAGGAPPPPGSGGTTTDYTTGGPHAAPLRGTIGTVDNPIQSDRTLIYGPFEAGFTAAQTQQFFGCNPGITVPAGIDTLTAEKMVQHACNLPATTTVLDDCGGHANPYHYHERMTCLYTEDPTTGHSTRIGTALDGNGIYGKYVSFGQKTPTDLDVCGGRTGVTPDSGGQTVYYYMVQDTAPFTVGCFGPVSSVQECKALYPNDCDNGDTITVTTAEGSRSYDPECPCWEPNRASTGAPAASTNCDANQYYDTSASACANCPANSGAPAASSSATACTCNAGFSGPNGGPCAQCVAGKYKSAQGSDPCSDCGAGKYSGSVGAVSDAACSECGAGKYSSAAGQMAESTCSTCPANSDAPAASDAAVDCVCNAGYTGPGGGTCTACPAGATSVSGASSAYDCVCAPGFVGAGSACDPCPAGTFKAMQGSNPCTACPLDHYAPMQATSSSACYLAPKVVFSLAMGGSVTAVDVNETVRSQLLTKIASSLGLDASLLRITSVSDARRRLLAVSVQVEALAADKDAAAALQARTAEVESAAQTAATSAGLVVTGVTAVASLVPAATTQQGGGASTPPVVVSMTTEVSGTGADSDSAAASPPAASDATSSASACSFSLRLVLGWACSLGVSYVFSPGT